MEIIKKTIFLDDYISRASGSTYGTITAQTFYFQIFLKQDMDDMGTFTNVIYTPKSTNVLDKPNYNILINKLKSIDEDIEFPFMTNANVNTLTNISPYYRTIGKNETDFYNYFNSYNNLFQIFENKNLTENRINDLRSYTSIKFTVGLDIDRSVYVNYINQTISGSSRVIQLTPKEIYVFDADQNNKNGLYYENIDNSFAFVTYNIEGINMTNTVLSAITKEEYLFGITSKPEIKSDVFIDRGITKVIERQLRISEVKNVNQLERYQNNYFNVTRF